MRLASSCRPTISLLLVVLLCCGAAQASITMAGQPDLRREVQPTGREATLSFRAPFEISRDAHAYFKVMPSPGNPVLVNGTHDTGWWTTVRVEGPDGRIVQEGTNGNRTVHFGTLQGNTTYWLHLDVRVPAGELAQPRELALRYAVAAKSTGGSGSGGQLDDSVAVKAIIVVSPDAPSSVGDAPQANAWLAMGPVAAAGLACVAVLVGVVLWRRP